MSETRLCECGCGLEVGIVKRTILSRGHVKGEPLRFIMGHASKGKDNPNWRGGRVATERRRIHPTGQKREKLLEVKRRASKELFARVVAGYGNECISCPEVRLEALLLHHPNMNGKKHRKKVGSGHALYQHLITNKFPDEVVLMCGTCHLILHRKEGVF